MSEKSFVAAKPASQSRGISTSQTALHEHLEDVVKKHIHIEYRKPIQTHNHAAFDEFLAAITNRKPKYLILDSCCGTGMSSFRLAQKNPDALIVGIDQSRSRLERKGSYKRAHHANNSEISDENCVVTDNVLLLRANCEDFWRLCISHNICFCEHYILYPNPYPKPGHLQRRWHGHPAFAVLPSLAASVEVRSNWDIYIKEFAQAWYWLTGRNADVQNLLETELEAQPFTFFEKKYHESGQTLWRVVAH